MKRSRLLTLIAALSLSPSAEAEASASFESDARLLLSACGLKILRLLNTNFKNPDAKTCSDPSLKVIDLNQGLGDKRINLSLKSNIIFYSVGTFVINVQSGAGNWFSYTYGYLPRQKVAVEYIKKGKSPSPPISELDQEAMAWLHTCKAGVSKYFASTYELSSIWHLKSCSNRNVDLSILAPIFKLNPKDFNLESDISPYGDEGYSISILSKSGKWFSLIWAYDDLLPQIPPLLIEGRPTP